MGLIVELEVIEFGRAQSHLGREGAFPIIKRSAKDTIGTCDGDGLGFLNAETHKVGLHVLFLKFGKVCNELFAKDAKERIVFNRGFT